MNIPVASLPAEQVVSGQEVTFFGMRYVIPIVREWPRTIIAIKLGGAVIIGGAGTFDGIFVTGILAVLLA